MAEKIFVIEDDESIRRMLEVALRTQGYEPWVYENATDALEAMNTATPAVAVVDLMMEGMDGITAVRLMRQSEHLQNVPVIMLTAKDTEEDKITGLDAGADDYVTKPFSVLELCARVRAQLRRKAPIRPAPAAMTIGDIDINPQTREVLRGGEPVTLTFKEFELLYLLMQNSDRAVSRAELLHEIWGSDFVGETRTLDMHVGTLRQKLQDPAENSRYIKTVRGVGYRFVGGGQG